MNYNGLKISNLSFQSHQLRLFVVLPLLLIWIGVILASFFIVLFLAVFLSFLSSLIEGGKILSKKVPAFRIGMQD